MSFLRGCCALVTLVPQNHTTMQEGTIGNFVMWRSEELCKYNKIIYWPLGLTLPGVRSKRLGEAAVRFYAVCPL
jgi:hypothetical protein